MTSRLCEECKAQALPALSATDVPDACWLHLDETEENEYLRHLCFPRAEALPPGRYDYLDLSRRVLRGVEFSAGSSLCNVTFRGAVLENVDFVDVDLTGCDFERAILRNVRFKGTRLPSASGARPPENSPPGMRLTNANFRWARLEGCTFEQADLRQSNFWHAAALPRTSRGSPPAGFFRCALSDATFEAALLNQIPFKDCVAVGANFHTAEIVRPTFQGGDFSRCTFQEATISIGSLNDGFTHGISLTRCDFSEVVVKPLTVDNAGAAPDTERGSVLGNGQRLTFEPRSFEDGSFVSAHLTHVLFRSWSDPHHTDKCRFTAADFTDADLFDVQFQGVNLKSSNFNMTGLHGVSFLKREKVGCDLQNSTFDQSVLEDVVFEACSGQACSFAGCFFTSSGNTRKYGFRGGRFRNANFTNAVFEKVSFGADNTDNVDLSGAVFRDAVLGGVSLEAAIFNEAQMTGVDFTGIHKQRIPAACTFRGAVLDRANLSKITIAPKCDFSDASLIEANLSLATVSKVNFDGANLNECDLSGVTATEARFRSAQLREANLFAGMFQKCDFTSADLTVAYTIPPWLRLSEATSTNLESGSDFHNICSCILRSRGVKPGSLLIEQESEPIFRSIRNELRANFSDALLPNTQISGALFIGSVLRNAKLDWAQLTGVDLRDVSLCSASLNGANLDGATFGTLPGEPVPRNAPGKPTDTRQAVDQGPRNWNMAPANLCKVNASGASFVQASLVGCATNYLNLEDARLEGTAMRGLFALELNCSLATIAGVSDFESIHFSNLDRGRCARCGAAWKGQPRANFAHARIETTVGPRWRATLRRVSPEEQKWKPFLEWLKWPHEGKPDWNTIQKSMVAWKNNYSSLGWYAEQSECFVQEKISEGRTLSGGWLHSTGFMPVVVFNLWLILFIFLVLPVLVAQALSTGMSLISLLFIILAGAGLGLPFAPSVRNLMIRGLYRYGEAPARVLLNASILVIAGAFLHAYALDIGRIGIPSGAESQVPAWISEGVDGAFKTVANFTTVEDPVSDSTRQSRPAVEWWYVRYISAAQSIIGLLLASFFVFSLARRTAGR